MSEDKRAPWGSVRSSETRAPKGSLTPDEARTRKNERQKEYAKRTGYAANKKYSENNPDKTGIVVSFRLYPSKDADVIEELNKAKSKADYIRQLVRNDIANKLK